MNVPKMASINESAKITGLPPHFIRTLCIEGKISAVRAGTGKSKWIVNVDRLVDFLNAPPVPQEPPQQKGIRRIPE